MAKKQMQILIGVVVVLVVAIIVYFVIQHNKNGYNNSVYNQTQTTPTPSPTATASPTPTTSGSAASKAYQAALAIYQTSGYRFQMAQCHGTPGKLVIKKGQKFMIDNRDPKAHTFGVKSQTFRIAGDGYAIVTAIDLGTYNITCDGGGAASLTVEK